MKASVAVRKLNAELKHLHRLERQEKAAEHKLEAKAEHLVDAFVASPSVGGVGQLVKDLLKLGDQWGNTHDRYEKAIATDVKQGRALLEPALPALTLKQYNQDRVELGLKKVDHKPVTYGQPWHQGPGQLKGSDTSHYQSTATFHDAVAGTQFAAIKATQGTHYVDPTFKARWKELGQKIDHGKMSLRIAYCFLDKGHGAAQAKHFLDTLGIHGKLKPGTRLCLDWEASALSSPQTLKDAANYIHKVTGLWPLVYTSASRVSQAKHAVPNAPIWEAKWTNGRADHSVPFVQYSDGPGYDHDVFNGTLKALKHFAGFAV